MASFKTTLKRTLLDYHSIFPSPSHALCHFFCRIETGHEWINGEIVDTCNPSERKKKKISDIGPWDHIPEDIKKARDQDPGFILKTMAEEIQKKFVFDNINLIIKASPTNTYFGDEPDHSLIDFVYSDCNAFIFPNNIKKDWGEALHIFLDYWLMRLRKEYGDDELKWPTNIQLAQTMIQNSQKRLHPILYNGEPYKTLQERMSTLFKGSPK